MLQRNFRLPVSVRFGRNAQTFVSPFFLVKIAPNSLPVSRFGFLVSKKVDKRAVVRNRVKRQIRAGVEALLGKIRSGHDVLFIIRQSAVGQETNILFREVEQALVRRGLVTTQNTV